MISKTEDYYQLLSLSYDGAVNFLLNKYGPSKDNYFKEKSYNRFLNKEIKSIAKGKYSRTSEGLYCHHIAENEFANLSNNFYISNYNIHLIYRKKSY